MFQISTVNRSRTILRRVSYHKNTLCASKFSTNQNVDTSPPESQEDGPLKGIKVLDLSRILAAPFCSMILGDYGAEVIKVEHPEKGDDTRSWGPPFTSQGGESTYFLSANRNKMSLALNLKHSKGLEIVKQLAAESDVLIENFKPGTTEKMGLDFSSLCKRNPRLIYASLTGYGETGPQRDHPAYDVMIAAQGGLMGITGPEDGTPAKVGVAITDITSGLYLHGAILAALYARERTGKGQKVSVSLLGAQVASLANAASAWLGAGHVTRPRGTAHESIVPYQAFKGEDGWIVVGALNDSQFQKLGEALGEPLWRENPKFQTNAKRVQHREELCHLLGDILKKKKVKEWLEIFRSFGVPSAPVQSLPQVFADPQVTANQMVQSINHPTVGPLSLPSPPVTFSSTPAKIALPPPLKGQHSHFLLQRLGYSSQQIQQLEEERVTFVPKAKN